MEPWQLILMAVGPTGAAWVGVKTALNGTAQRVKRIEDTVDILSEEVTKLRVTMGSIRDHQ